MNPLVLALAQVELGIISIEEFRTTLSEMKKLSLDEIHFGSGGAKDEVWIAILEEMKKRSLLTPEMLIGFYNVVDHCVLQKEISRLFQKHIDGLLNTPLINLFAISPVSLQKTLFEKIIFNGVEQDGLVAIFKKTSSLEIQSDILKLLISGPAEILAHLFLATPHVEIQRIIAEQESVKNLDANLILLLVSNAKDQKTGRQLLSILESTRKVSSPEEDLEKLTMEDLVDLFNKTDGIDNREKIMGLITLRMSEMTPVLHILLIGNQTVGAQLTLLGMLVAGQMVEPKRRDESQIEKDIRDMQMEDLLELFTKIHDPNSPIRHLIGAELKKRLQETN